LNAGTVALQYYFAQVYDTQGWVQALDPVNGFPALYERLYGSPWMRALQVEPLYPPDLAQPELVLPFFFGQLWSYTGGPHGAWEHDGAMAALDFAPAGDRSGCTETNAWVLASAPGQVVRSGNGVVVLDLDGDGNEQTGWAILYLHIATDGRIANGTWVETGDLLGKPSCEGGRATGTHVHMARKYNGEWIAADGPLPFVLDGWTAHAGKAPYYGTLTRDGETITASQVGSYESRILRLRRQP
jgi:murein DD-endopeptidase MepM/ murein hydrolase activator NlpD